MNDYSFEGKVVPLADYQMAEARHQEELEDVDSAAEEWVKRQVRAVTTAVCGCMAGAGALGVLAVQAVWRHDIWSAVCLSAAALLAGAVGMGFRDWRILEE